MTKVHMVKHARKNYPEHGIVKGDTYYWWQFAFRPKQFSKTPPKPAQLTQSAFLQSLYEIQDRIRNLSPETVQDLSSELEEIINDIENLRDEQEEKRNNMPEQLQESNSGELLQERYDGLDSWISELQSIDLDFEPEEGSSEEKKQADLKEFLENVVSEIQETDSGL
jgi:hypothetical protein